MLQAFLLVLVTSILVSALNVQESLGFSRHRQLQDDGTEWNLDKLPNPNGTDHLVFDSVYSLLQRWPNTRMRNGHSIVPGIIPKGTLLYHGTINKELPPGPEWVATDPEHAYLFCWDILSVIRSQDKCWYHTLITTRPLNIIYFDGSSAAKVMDGSLDAQDLLIWGESRSENVYEELRRIKDICEWVKKFDIDGIVRMSMDFELMLCDFKSGVVEVSFVNLEPAKGFLASFTTVDMFEAINAGSRHSRFPGETRVQLDLTKLISFYDTKLVPSLVAVRASQERWDYRLRNISNEDLSTVKARVEAAMSSPRDLSSGIDWKTLVQVIVDLFAQRLEFIHHLLNSPATSTEEVIDLANKTQTQLRIMLAPHIVLSAIPTDPSDKTDLDWTIPIYKLCAMTHTHSIELVLDSMTDSERLILQAVRGTTREICRVTTKMWAAGVCAGIDTSLNTKEQLDVAEIVQVRRKGLADLNRLMGWLDWSVWVKCDPECGRMEMCYLPTWPVGFPGFPPNKPGQTDQRKSTGFELRIMAFTESFVEGRQSTIKPGPDEWIRPQPKCIRRYDPYEF